MKLLNYGKNYLKKDFHGIYNIIPKHLNNRAIDISCADNENMANLQLYEFNNSKAQQFEVKYNSKYKYHTIKCLCSNKFLSVDIKNNYNIVQYEEKNQIDQQWHIVFKEKLRLFSIFKQLLVFNHCLRQFI